MGGDVLLAMLEKWSEILSATSEFSWSITSTGDERCTAKAGINAFYIFAGSFNLAWLILTKQKKCFTLVFQFTKWCA